MTAIIAENLATEIVQKRRSDLATKIKNWPRRLPYLSDIGECDRQIVYSIKNWEDRPPYDEDLQARFDVGKLWEREITRDLQGLGYEVILAQDPVEIKGRDGQLIAVGKLDGYIKAGHKKIPIEIKSLNPNVYKSIHSLEDFEKKAWLRKYLRQMTMYLFGTNQEAGLMILTDCLGGWKILPIYQDAGECEKILYRLETISDHLGRDSFPERIPYNHEVCGFCPFAGPCLQDVIKKPAEMIDNKKLEMDLDRYFDLKPLAKEYDSINKTIKEIAEHVEKIIVGSRYIIQSIPTARITYKVPDEINDQIKDLKKEHGTPVPVRKLLIQELGKEKSDEAA